MSSSYLVYDTNIPSSEYGNYRIDISWKFSSSIQGEYSSGQAMGYYNIIADDSRFSGSSFVVQDTTLKYSRNGGSASYMLSQNNSEPMTNRIQVGFKTNKTNILSTVSITIYQRDVTPPTNPVISVNPPGYTQGNVAVSIGGSTDTGGVARYEYSLQGAHNLGWTGYSSPITITNPGQTIISARAVDVEGNVSGVSTASAYIDRTAPASPAIYISRTGWSNTDVTVGVNIHGADSQSGVSRSEIAVTGATSIGWQTYTSTYNISANGQSVVHARTIDNAGNVGQESIGVIYIDKLAPNRPTINMDSSWNGSKQFTLQHGADNGESGVNRSQYKLGDSGAWTDYTGPVTINQENLVVYARTIDNAGNIGETAQSNGNIDRTPPTVPSITLSETAYTSKDVTVTVTNGQDAMSGVLKSQYRVGSSGAWTDYTGPFQVTQEGATTVYARTVDRAGNISGETSAVARIIRTKPIRPLVGLSIMDWTNQDIKVGMSHPNNPSGGISYKMQYKIGDTGTWTDFQSPFMFGEEGVKIYGRVVDAAGNISDETVAEPRIDRTAPTEPVIQSELNPSGTGANITVTPGTDALSGVSKTEYRLGDQGIWADYASTFTVSLQDTVTVYAKTTDRVGNVSIEAVETIEADLYEKTLAEAVKAVEKAEASKLQSDINTARSLISELKDADQQPLLGRLNAIQIIPDVPQDQTKPSAPVGLIGTNVTPTSIKLVWKAATDDAGRVSYEIYDGGQLVGETRELFYELSNLNPQQSYVFTVKTKDAAGNYSDPSNAVSKGVSQNYKYIYDAAGRLDTVELDGKVIFDYQYDKNGNLLRIVPNP
ncbi:fibronectin type III domain-containing protein [Paenibacillus sp. P96]|uniref:Fibronectin type III domain-containing protein n=1 Tax=Paenibacillus zeirhizosphaerae TaxID=2987519 RepID=A0ABT9FUW0_9BACL|nr:fibronectin type III domain-containing protein [Paenibacillus sp. P96]MDP4098469.1 fibronectin type III domain-containing protein [Paenibacillus sp. P96]